MVESNGSQNQVIQVWSSDNSYEDLDQIAREVAIAIVYNGISHAVMMAVLESGSDLTYNAQHNGLIKLLHINTNLKGNNIM